MMRYVTTNLCKAFRCGTSLASLVYESVNRYLGRLPEAEVSQTRKDPMDGWIRAIASPNVVLGSAGTVQLEWRVGGRDLEVELGESGELAYLKVSPQGGLTE